jgi:hypothetical protein
LFECRHNTSLFAGKQKSQLDNCLFGMVH